MKILILNPHIDAQHSIVQALKARGDAVLVSTQVDEGWKILQVHGASIDLAVLHREGKQAGDSGTELNARIKNDASLADLPVLFTSQTWDDEQCANHQQTPMGANAYLHWPFDSKKLIGTIEAIFGPEASAVFPQPGETHSPTLSIVAPHPKMDMGGMVLEDPSGFFNKSAMDLSKSDIHLSKFESTKSSIEKAPTPNFPKLAVPANPPAALPLETAIETPGISLAPPVPSQSPSQSKDGDISRLLQPNLSAPLASLEPSASGQSGISLVSDSPEQPPGPPPTSTSVAMPTPSEPPGFERQGLNLEVPEGLTMGGLTASSSDNFAPPAPTFEPTSLEMSHRSVEDDSPQENAEAEKELPYLFNNKQSPAQPLVQTGFSHPVGDSVVPGGASQAPDVETLKKYLLLREQDVAALSGQLKATRDENAELNQNLRGEKDRAEGLELIVNDQQRKIDEFEREKAIALETLNTEIAEIRFQSKAKSDKAKLLEQQVNNASQEIERLKERVRSDIRKIRVRERDLENQLELTKKDTEVVLNAREAKIVELKRKIDLLEFNMDLLQDRFNRERETNNKMREKLVKAAQVVRVAEGLLDEPQAPQMKDIAGSLTGVKSSDDKAS